MATSTLIYNLLMAVIDALLLVWLSRRRTFVAWLLVGLTGLTAAACLAFGVASAVDPDRFVAMRLAAYGLFLHEIALLAGAAMVLRRARPAGAIVSLGFALVGVAVAWDAFLVEPHWLEVSRIRLVAPPLSKPMRLVLMADLQTDTFGPYERDVFRRVMQEKPDVILLGGDYLQADNATRAELRRQMGSFLREIRFSAPQGVFAVQGNVDPDDWPALFAGLPVTTIERTRSFDLGPVRLTCLSEADSFRRRLKVPSVGPGRFHVVLGHAPSYAMGKVQADLLLAGHTHGGQVRLPWIGPITTLSPVPRHWCSGCTELPGGARLYVSRGIGMERGRAPRLRFFCRPELVVIDLVPK